MFGPAQDLIKVRWCGLGVDFRLKRLPGGAPTGKRRLSTAHTQGGHRREVF
jgi:hypothetical protein